MSTETELACPVCRAKQAYQTECRRCGADLSLWIKTLRSVQAAQQQVEEALLKGDPHVDVALAYLRWLSPSRGQAVVERYAAGEE